MINNSNKIKSLKISDLKNRDVRNIIRGVIGESNPYKIDMLLNKIKLKYGNFLYEASLDVIRGNQLFKDNEYSRYFLDYFLKLNQNIGSKNPSYIYRSINLNKSKLVNILKIYNNILFFLNLKNIEKLVDNIEMLTKLGGVSVFLLRILQFIKNNLSDEVSACNLGERIDAVYELIRPHNINYINVAIKELTSDKNDYFSVCDRINLGEENIPLTIARSFIDQIPDNEAEYIKVLNSFYSVSMIDAVLYILSTARLEIPYISVQYLDKEIIKEYNSIKNMDFDIMQFYDRKEQFCDLYFFRDSFLLNEISKVYEYRIAVSYFYTKKTRNAIPYQRNKINNYFSGLRDLLSLRNEERDEYSINIYKYNRYNCGIVENTCGLIYLLENNSKFTLDYDEDVFISLMSFTTNLGEVLPNNLLDEIVKSTTNNNLRMIFSCLLFTKHKTQKYEHQLRSILQYSLENKFEYNIQNLLEYFYDTSPAIADYMVTLCDETFLTKLFIITKEPIDAIETRASILEWYGNKTSNNLLIERAKNLRIDIQISKQKANIDDSRIYVDPIKYIQWINDTVLNELLLSLDSINIDNISGPYNIDWAKTKTGITDLEKAASCLLVCFEEFCENKLFGIASYLGRRIRHGTLKGTGRKEILEFYQQKEKLLSNNKDFQDFYNKWFKEYDNTLDSLVSEYLHILSKKKPEGMIRPIINSKAKKLIADSMLRDIILSYHKNPIGIDLPYIILEYCWRLIEEDLSNIRKHLMHIKSKYGIIKMPNLDLEPTYKREYVNFCSEINNITADKFRIISSWFNKPSIASPTADIVLLFKAVLSEVKDLITEHFSPEVQVNQEFYQITGGQYFAIYDALFIIIKNVADHGKLDGLLELDIQYHNEIKAIRVTVKSEFISYESKIKNLNSIRENMTNNSEGAHVVEGNSGIKKLKQMEIDNYISNVNYTDDKLYLIASFDFKMDY
ncbi:hypothetical protein [Aggregatibacter kilianii]|uniref:hypothetical protein n=1 Tax=Aggregatibacter kilianii TaxID=2025884 RepID=UPI0028D52883|nr:hypothetical protein [Aggregatibacter kilianii]